MIATGYIDNSDTLFITVQHVLGTLYSLQVLNPSPPTPNRLHFCMACLEIPSILRAEVSFELQPIYFYELKLRFIGLGGGRSPVRTVVQ